MESDGTRISSCADAVRTSDREKNVRLRFKITREEPQTKTVCGRGTWRTENKNLN